MNNPKAPAQKSYIYKRYMRDGSVKEITAVVRSKRKTKEKNAEA